MNYRTDKYGNKISILGYGCMRFTQSEGKINLPKAESEILAAYNAGVNYYDTAYIYPGSEAALGEILERNNLRDKVYVADKLPHYLIKSRESLDKYLTEQLRRLRTDRIDYYLMHMLNDVATWEKLKSIGITEWLEEKKREGKIKQVGFSFHGNTDNFIKLVDAYDWEFCQIQYNYMDENSQAGRRGLQYAAGKGIPVVIMEPLRGGKLVRNLPDEAMRIFDEYPTKQTPAQWSLRWLWSQSEVTCVLSGMNSLEMVADNTATASTASVGELGEAENEMLKSVVRAINAKMKVGCTGCGYCMPCPKGVDIPGTFASYNHRYSDGWRSAFSEHFMTTAMRKDPSSASNCIGCGKCEKHCPQHIEIRKELKNARRSIEGPIYKVGKLIVRVFKLY